MRHKSGTETDSRIELAEDAGEFQEKKYVPPKPVNFIDSIPERAKKAFEKMPTETIQIPFDPLQDQKKQLDVVLIVNGVELRVPRGKPFAVPVPFAEVWRNSQLTY